MLGAWNVRTLLDRDKVCRPERRTALVAKELTKYNIDIAALSETRFSGEGSLEERGSGYTFCWKGREENESCIHGLGFAIRTTLLRQLPDLPTGINERLMKLRFPLNPKRHVTIVSAYAPTLGDTDDAKDHFYQELDNIIRSTPASDKLVLLVDFNARVGRDSGDWPGVMGHHGIGKVNNNGLLLLSKCAEHSLSISNTFFRQADKYKTTWMHPRSKQWHLIDYVIVRQRDISDVMITRSMRGAECWTDHRLVRATLNLRIAPLQQKRPKISRSAYNISKLRHIGHREQFQSVLDEKLSCNAPATNSGEKWSQFKEAVIDTAKSVLGPKQRSHQDWFDENDSDITNILHEKQAAYIDWQNDPNSSAKKMRFKHLQANTQRKLREMQDKWWEAKADELQGYAECNNSKKFFDTLKTVYGPSKGVVAPLQSADGTTLFKDKEGITARWAEHFSTLLNRPSSVEEQALDRIPQRPVQENLDIPPTLEEVFKAVKQTSAGKSAGKDNIPAELFKEASTKAMEEFHNIICSIWAEESMPDDFRDATIVALYKNKGSKSDCGNYRGISLLSIAGKILARILLNRLIENVSEDNLPEAQCGFRPGRSTVDMIFTVRQVQEKCLEQQMDLYAVFIDLTKAFDTVNREALWTILGKFGCPRKFVQIIRLFHDEMVGQVLHNGDASDPFKISNGVKQGCVLAPVLFNLFFTCVLKHATQDLERGIYVRYRTDGSLFDLRRLSSKTKTTLQLVLEALFADDCALMAHNSDDLQYIVDRFAEAADLFGLTISLGKTEVLFQPHPTSQAPQPAIAINGTPLKCVDEFKYLGSTISNDGSLDKEIRARICKASQALGRLRVKVLNHHNIRLSTKLKIYKAVVITSLLYGCESWTLYRRHVKLLEQFHQRSLRSIMGIRWQDKITNIDVLDRAETISIESMLLKAQLRWVGHIIRMPDYRLPKQLLFGELTQGKRKVGRPRKRFKDSLKLNIKWGKIEPRNLQRCAEDRSQWRSLVHSACNSFETERRNSLQLARERRHKAASTTISTTDFQCPIPGCARLCASRFGLQSHMRSHR